MKKITLTIKSSEGLHARPASIFVKAASSFKSNIKIIKNDDASKEYAGKSIISIMAMAAANGDKITIIADGEDEDIAISELGTLVETGF
ncbi:phosphocarrier protein [Anaerovirgula multivorans]|uniref:Phosphocarrier protein HPr n=1 Tax=Anaerovirgula multivorans TaxID=312168 RepID=A0A239C1I7_9FIRM|nr:HPr family phosphocarrier protein [Anaerovirgula multivorans]SNS14000.1 phosphocarrier protein [Anaerovirgula multivorans]